MNEYTPGQKVVYRAPHIRVQEPGEEGVVVADRGGAYVHVRYGNDVTAKATPRECLVPIALDAMIGDDDA